MKAMPDGDFRLNEMITEDMVADEYDRKTSCQLRFQQTSVEVISRRVDKRVALEPTARKSFKIFFSPGLLEIHTNRVLEDSNYSTY